ncbi:MAG: hypothetical protein EXR62_08200 [Chloroflexi bacterium]|nr:hypothetical protein [Chloroflexota bacterium]
MLNRPRGGAAGLRRAGKPGGLAGRPRPGTLAPPAGHCPVAAHRGASWKYQEERTDFDVADLTSLVIRASGGGAAAAGNHARRQSVRSRGAGDHHPMTRAP